MAGVPYKKKVYDLSAAASDAQWTIHSAHDLELTLNCPQCSHLVSFLVVREYKAELDMTQVEEPLYGWTAERVPDSTYCRCGQEHMGRPPRVVEGCGANYTGLRALFKAKYMQSAK